MPQFTLVDSAGAVLKKSQGFDARPPDPTGKGWRWLPDNPPAFDARHQLLTVNEPVPGAALEVPYTVSARPLADLIDQRKRALSNVARDKFLDNFVFWFGTPTSTLSRLKAFVDAIQTHTTAIDGLTTGLAVVDYDITAGWPV